LLDLLLPKLHSGDVFKAIKTDERTRFIPVMIIGTDYDAKLAGIENAEHHPGRMLTVEQ
jgi:CheY-like chemotaxis protein